MGNSFKIKGWIARDDDGVLNFFDLEPVLDEEKGMFYCSYQAGSDNVYFAVPESPLDNSLQKVKPNEKRNCTLEVKLE